VLSAPKTLRNDRKIKIEISFHEHFKVEGFMQLNYPLPYTVIPASHGVNLTMSDWTMCNTHSMACNLNTIYTRQCDRDILYIEPGLEHEKRVNVSFEHSDVKYCDITVVQYQWIPGSKSLPYSTPYSTSNFG
jgi:hypothetical protein